MKTIGWYWYTHQVTCLVKLTIPTTRETGYNMKSTAVDLLNVLTWQTVLNMIIDIYIWNYRISRSETKMYRFILKIEHQILAKHNFSDFDNHIINNIMSMLDVLWTIHNFSEPKSLNDSAKIRSSLKHHFIRYSLGAHHIFRPL